MDSSFAFLKASVSLCLSPVLSRRSNMRSPLLGDRVFAGRYACGTCEVCCWQWSREVERRAVREFDATPAGHAAVKVDLTFSDDSLGAALPDFGKSLWRRFSVALCRAYQAAVPGALPLKLLATPELGKLNGRLHIHAVVFCVRESFASGPTRLENGRQLVGSPFLDLVRQLWRHGFVNVDPCHSRGAVRYVIKYALKGREGVAARLKEHRAAAKRARALGLGVPSFVNAWWLATPRGRGGGLSRGFADALGALQPGGVPGTGDIAPVRVGGPNGREVVLSRYERRRARSAAGLDDEGSKLLRAAANPEPVEMAARQLAAGGFLALRSSGAYRDDAEAAHRRGKIRVLKNLGR